MSSSLAIISISGRLSAGKSTVARMFEAAGNWDSIEAAPDTVERLISGGLHRRDGGAGSSRGRAHGLVIDGLCSLADWALLKARYGMDYTSIHVEAPRDVRRLRRLGWTEFDSDFHAADDRSGPGIDQLKACADYCIRNDATIEQLSFQVAPIIVQSLTPTN